MPRIYDSTNDPLDFCLTCWPSEGAAEFFYKYLGDGPDGRGNCFGYDEDHPDYEGEMYVCRTCRMPLGCEDNIAPAATKGGPT